MISVRITTPILKRRSIIKTPKADLFTLMLYNIYVLQIYYDIIKKSDTFSFLLSALHW